MTAQDEGFTLIELVIVILLLGILAAFAVPKWLGKGGFETHTLRDELVARLRLVQSINMNEGSARCSQLVLEANRFGHLTQACGTPPKPIANWSTAELSRGHVVTASAGLGFSPPQILGFDPHSGRPLPPCSNGCELKVSDGGETTRLRIEPEGYIHALP